MKLWSWIPSTRPKNFQKALNILMSSKRFTLTVRTLAIATGSSRWQVEQWIDGHLLPTNNEIREIAGAFCLNALNRVTCKERNLLMAELLIIATTERTR
tara:strand:+ start:467 stop:763 length:297 start_codon:yes stop_codon:yes gene_type:complete